MEDVATMLAEKIIQTANDGYGRRDDYPPYALASWDDRLRWSDYIKKIAAEVIAEHLAAPPLIERGE